MVCGTDGVTYANHCKFVHAACQYENLHVHNHGACPPGFSTTTIAPGGSMATGSQSGSGTTAPSSAYIQSMFCRNKEFIGCPATFNIVCGSNGLFYPNSCELSKAVCDAPSLVEIPCSQSQSTQPPLPTTTTPARTTTHAGPIPIIGRGPLPTLSYFEFYELLSGYTASSRHRTSKLRTIRTFSPPLSVCQHPNLHCSSWL